MIRGSVAEITCNLRVKETLFDHRKSETVFDCSIVFQRIETVAEHNTSIHEQSETLVSAKEPYN